VTRGRYDLVVVGAGPAGLAAAAAASDLRARVALVEREHFGGTCLNTGCVPSKAIIRTSRLAAQVRDAERYGALPPAGATVDFATVMRRMRAIRDRTLRPVSPQRLAAAGVEVFVGEARFTGVDSLAVGGTPLRFVKAIVASGSRPEPPNVPGVTEADYLTNENVFDLTELPRRLLVVGGGPLGCELAQAFARLGSRTTIVQQQPLFLPHEERDAAQILSASFARDGIDVRLNTHPVEVRTEDGAKRVELLSDDYRSSVVVDRILAGVGRLPNVAGMDLEAAGVAYDECAGIRVDDFLRTTNPRVYAAGDCCLEHKYTHTADPTARMAVQNALGRARQRVSSLVIPWCTYTDPEIAHVGLYVRQANEQGIPVKTFTVPMHETIRALTDDESTGFVKIHVGEGGDRILGGTIVARHAGEMLNEITLAMVAGVGLRTLSRVIHPYPTQAEAIKKAADACSRAMAKPRRVAR
jgi:pyruvate/2-oxoglutarate dehydrogenase complex dihydrolipoamide dehydrogenase (E3) component